MEALVAGFWGFVGGVALLIGALIGIYADACRRVFAVVMAVWAGVLVASVAFELMEESYAEGGFDAASIGLVVGAVAPILRRGRDPGDARQHHDARGLRGRRLRRGPGDHGRLPGGLRSEQVGVGPRKGARGGYT